MCFFLEGLADGTCELVTLLPDPSSFVGGNISILGDAARRASSGDPGEYLAVVKFLAVRPTWTYPQGTNGSQNTFSTSDRHTISEKQAKKEKFELLKYHQTAKSLPTLPQETQKSRCVKETNLGVSWTRCSRPCPCCRHVRSHDLSPMR